MVTPDESSRMVFMRGILMGLKKITIRGGQDSPNSKVGDTLL